MIKNENNAVYKILCSGCSAYYGKTSQSIERRVSVHKCDVRHNRTSNSMVLHAEERVPLPDWISAEVLHTAFDKMTKTVEAAYISQAGVMNHRDGCVKLACVLAGLIMAAAEDTGKPTNEWEVRGESISKLQSQATLQVIH